MGEWKNGVLQGAGEVIYPSAKIVGTFTDNESMQAPAKVQFDHLQRHTLEVNDPTAFGLKTISA